MRIGICDPSMRKVRLTGFAILCSVSLSACVGSEGFSFAQKGTVKAEQTGAPVPKSTSTTLARGTVKLKAPKGYCIDDSSVSSGLQSSSAMLAKCTSLDGKGAGADTAVMSVQVSARRKSSAPAPSTQDLVMAALPARALQSRQKGNLALVQLATGGNDIFSPADPVHWRGATVLDTRLVLLSLFAPSGSTLTKDQGAELLTTLARGLSATRGPLLGRGLSNNAPVSEVSEEAQPKSVVKNSTTDTVEPEKKGGQGIIARLLNRS